MNQIREKHHIFVYIGAILILSLFVVFRYLPLRQRAASVKIKCDQIKDNLQRASLCSTMLSTLKKKGIELESEIGNYDARIPTDRSLGVFLQQIAYLMDKHDLDDQLVKPGNQLESGELNCIPINMQCSGNFAQIFEFFKSLQTMDRLIRIERVEFGNTDGFTGRVTMQTQAVIYYRPGSQES